MECGEKMDAEQSNGMSRGNDPGRGVSPQHPLERVLDVIARNDKDVHIPQDGISAAPPSVASSMAMSGLPSPHHPFGGGPYAQVAASPMALVTSILRFKWTLALVFSAVAAPLIAVIWTQVVPEYTARAEVRVRPIIPRLVFQTEDNGARPFYESFVNTQVSDIRGQTVLQRVLEQEAIQKTAWYEGHPKTLLQRLRGNPAPAIERLRRGLSVRPRTRTEIIDVSFSDASANEARLIVNTVLQQYLRYTGEATDAEDERLYQQLLDQYRQLEAKIKGRETVCADLRRSLETQSPEELISSKRVHLDTVEARLRSLRSTVALLEWEVAQATQNDSNAVTASDVEKIEREPEYDEDAEWRRLDLQVKTIERQMATSFQKPNHPGNLLLAKDLEFNKKLLKEREMQLDEDWRNRPTDVVETPRAVAGAAGPNSLGGAPSPEFQLARAREEEKHVLAEYEKEKQDFETIFGQAQLLAQEMIALEHERELFDEVRQRKDQKDIERNVPGSIDVPGMAYTPSRPDQDRRVTFTAMALFLSLGIGGGAAFLRASRNQAIYAPEDIPQPMQVPFLGQVPLIHIKKPLGPSLYEEVQQRQTVLSESIRTMRTVLWSRLKGFDGTTILVTSAMAGTGKSSFTMILGKSMAQAGKKVLMIDADFHKKRLSKCFGLLDKPGFLDSLGDGATEGQHVFDTETPGLSVMPAGKPAGNLGVEQIANGTFKTCIGRLRSLHGYDVILFDGSPILPLADAVILSSQVDGTIMVERESVSNRSNIADAIGLLRSAGGCLLGTVFVGSSTSQGYRYAYNSYVQAGGG